MRFKYKKRVPIRFLMLIINYNILYKNNLHNLLYFSIVIICISWYNLTRRYLIKKCRKCFKMKRIISIVLVLLLLCGCTTLSNDSSSSVNSIESTTTNITDNITSVEDITDNTSIDGTTNSVSGGNIVSSQITPLPENSSNISNTSSIQQTTSESSKVESENVSINECEVFSDLLRTDYIYNQSGYCSDGRYLYYGGNACNIYDTVTGEITKLAYNVSGLYIYNGYLTGKMGPNNSTNKIFIYDLLNKEEIVIDGVFGIDAAFIYGDYVYVKNDDSENGSVVQRSSIKSDDKKWEIIVNNVDKEFETVGKYLFGNAGESKQMFRLDLSTGEVLNYNNGLVLKKSGHLQSDNWIITNNGIFDVGSNMIKYANEKYDIVGNVGVKFDIMFVDWEECIGISLLNLKTGERVNKSIKFESGNPMGNISGSVFDIKGCTYNGLYFNNIFLKYGNNNNVLNFETYIASKDFYKEKTTGSYSLGNYKFGCICVLNGYYYYLSADTVYKSPLNDMNQKIKLPE